MSTDEGSNGDADLASRGVDIASQAVKHVEEVSIVSHLADMSEPYELVEVVSDSSELSIMVDESRGGGSLRRFRSGLDGLPEGG